MAVGWIAGIVLACAVLAAGAVAQAQATQPLSVSLTECHVLTGLMAESRSAASDPEKAAQLARWSTKFGLAAVDQARDEGRADPTGWVRETIDRVEPDWAAQVGNIFRIRDTLDWADYCRSLGLSRGLID